MDNQLISKLKKEMANRNVTTPKLALELGIKQDRLYKWLNGSSNPKMADTRLLENWLTGSKSEKDTGKNTEELDLGAAIKEMRAVTSAILAVSAEILANVSGRSAAVVRQEVDTLVKSILNASGPGL